jgi:hypothetical protein
MGRPHQSLHVETLLLPLKGLKNYTFDVLLMVVSVN